MEFDLSRTSQRETYNLLIGLVTPRPIAFITSLDREGRVNAAPFSALERIQQLSPSAWEIGRRLESLARTRRKISATPTNS
jgi:hypothetical protein